MSEARIPVKNFRSWDDVYALTTKAGVIFRPQGRKIGPTVCYFPSVGTENTCMCALFSILTDGK